jgi:hypothetical protein
VNAEFNWWLLIVGLVIGGGLVWLVLLDSRRREDEVSAGERALEAAWLSEALAAEGTALTPAAAERVLQLHAEYLATSMPPDGGPDPAPLPAHPPQAATTPEADPGT